MQPDKHNFNNLGMDKWSPVSGFNILVRTSKDGGNSMLE